MEYYVYYKYNEQYTNDKNQMRLFYNYVIYTCSI